MPAMVREAMVRRVRFGTEACCSVRRKARRRSKTSTVGQMRWSFVRIGSSGNFAISGEKGSVVKGVVGKVMVRWRHCFANSCSVSSCGAERVVVGKLTWRLVKRGGVAVETHFFASWEARRREAREVLGR